MNKLRRIGRRTRKKPANRLDAVAQAWWKRRQDLVDRLVSQSHEADETPPENIVTVREYAAARPDD